MVFAPPKRKLTADEYDRMGEAGILHEDERVELIDGEIYEMTPIGDDHVGAVNGLTFLFIRRLGDRVTVSPQNPIRLNDFSEPQPDVSILRFRADFYGTRKARPDDVHLLIEVARTSLDYDRLTKLPRYAAAGITEVWIVNLSDHIIEVYRDPREGTYTTILTYRRGEMLAPTAFPDLTIRVEEILG
jgi:Uma2 family endonuclease